MAKKTLFKQTAKVSANSTSTVLEVNKPSKFINSGEEKKAITPKPIAWKRWIRLTGITFGIVTLGLVALLISWYVISFQNTAGIKLHQLIGNYLEQKEQLPTETKPEVNVLLLGIDQSSNLREASLLTDTIILARISRENKSIKLISLPRDLWIDSLQTKINALYYYGQQNNPTDGVDLLSSIVTEISGVPIDYYLLLNMDSLREIINAIGGVELEVERSFEDLQYPREINLSSTDSSVLYKTVKFEAGLEKMDGDRALTYIRSRHSADEFEGTDEGRERRQQRLLEALKQQLFSPELIANPIKIGNLYQVWKNSFKTNINDVTAVSLARLLVTVKPVMEASALPVRDQETKGLIYHPDKGPANQWVYLPVDPSWEEIKLWFKQN